jgi:hypothetical protein
MLCDNVEIRQSNPFAAALRGAYQELLNVKEQELTLTIRKAQLTKTVNALFPLVFPQTPDINAMSLPNAIRLIMSGTERPLSAHDMKTKLEDLGFDLAKFDNPLANVHTAMKRMLESDELVYVDENKKRVTAGPELNPPPETSAGNPEEALSEMVSARALPEDGFYTPPELTTKK